MVVLDRNYRSGPRELDVVALDGRTLVFVEVKGRGSRSFGHPLRGISPSKRRQVEAAARGWLRDRGRHLHGIEEMRFDAVAVVPAAGEGAGGSAAPWAVEHLVDAWRPGLP
jgi:putative endonuclease